MGKGTVTSEEPVDVKLLNGTLLADKLRIINSGEIVRFEGNVKMNLVMDAPDSTVNSLETPEPPAAPKTRSTSPKPANLK
jgi:lipopolysaccharide export system protein LptC